VSRKVLIIATHFPPDRHIGARRPAKFAKYLPNFGWQPVILTVPINEIRDGVDNSLLPDLSKDLIVHRITGWGNSHVINNGSSKKKIKLLLRMRSRIGGLLFTHQSARWVYNSIKMGCKIIDSKKIDLIFSTVPDPEAYIAALFLSILKGKKFVCEFRDPNRWMFDYKFTFENIIMNFFQKVAQWKANAVVSTSKDLKRNLLKNGWVPNAKQYITIYNGFDINDFTGLSEKQNSNTFVISYVGSLGMERHPKYLLDAFELLLQEKPQLINKIKLLFIGWIKRDIKMEKWLEERLNQGVLKKTVELKGFLPHREALLEMQRSDVLLTLHPEEGNKQGVLEAKVFEYLYSGNPILALTPSDCDMAKLIREMKAGIVVPPDNPGLISKAIYKLYQDYCNGDLLNASRNEVKQQFERKQLTKRLAELFDGVMDGKENLMDIGW